jgi:hypothetical protein
MASAILDYASPAASLHAFAGLQLMPPVVEVIEGGALNRAIAWPLRADPAGDGRDRTPRILGRIDGVVAPVPSAVVEHLSHEVLLIHPDALHAVQFVAGRAAGNVWR